MKTDVDAAAPTEGLRAVAEPLRWKILALLAREELCVCHLVEALDAPQSLISHHLRVLRNAGLVDSDRFRYWTYYRLRTGAVEALGRQLIDLAGSTHARSTARRPCC